MTHEPQTLEEFLADPDNPHKTDGQLGTNANAVYLPSGEQSIVNVYLSPEQALRVARNLVQKAEMLISHNVQECGIQLWINQRKDKTGTLSFGLADLVKKNPTEP